MKDISATDPLFVGHRITIEGHAGEKLKPVIHTVLKPKPNNTLLWMRPALARYNMLSEKTRKKRFWRNKITGPVTLSQIAPGQVAGAIQNRLFHQGYFQNKVSYDTIQIGKRKVRLDYMIRLNQPYRYQSIIFPAESDELSKTIDSLRTGSLLKIGSVYTLESVKTERARIDEQLKERGYLYFNPEFIKVRVDSVSGDHQVRAALTIKPETPPESKKAYIIRRVYIHDDNTLAQAASDTMRFKNYYFISQNKTIRFDALQQGLFIKPGSRYAQSDYLNSIRYMNDLPIIRNTNIRFTPVKGSDSLDMTMLLSQRKRYAYTAELNAVFRSTNYFGPGMVFSYTDRNKNRGAEVLKVNLRGRFEAQIVDGQINPAYELGVELSYQLPRFYPVKFLKGVQTMLPKTKMSIGYNLFNRLDLYRLNSAFANFGYRWSKRDQVMHSFNPVEIVFTKIPEESKSQEFKNYLEENPGVQRSFDEQFIVGMGYEFTYQPSGHRNDFFFRGGVDVAGNALNAVYSLSNAKKDSLGRYTLTGVPYSQYVRIRADFRYSFNFRQNRKLVARFTTGIGIPIGNSDILPYVKQFYVGGTNSLRSFIARSVGPGSEVPPGGYNDLTGDIRIEGNAEYRFTLSGNLKGALFVDAGNIWLYREDPYRPNGTFRFNKFINELAVSSGWGIRWDFDFMVARLDFAYTLRTPYLPEGERWLTKVNFWNPALNIAIGYPF